MAILERRIWLGWILYVAALQAAALIGYFRSDEPDLPAVRFTAADQVVEWTVGSGGDEALMIRIGLELDHAEGLGKVEAPYTVEGPTNLGLQAGRVAFAPDGRAEITLNIPYSSLPAGECDLTVALSPPHGVALGQPNRHQVRIIKKEPLGPVVSNTITPPPTVSGVTLTADKLLYEGSDRQATFEATILPPAQQKILLYYRVNLDTSIGVTGAEARVMQGGNGSGEWTIPAGSKEVKLALPLPPDDGPHSARKVVLDVVSADPARALTKGAQFGMADTAGGHALVLVLVTTDLIKDWEKKYQPELTKLWEDQNSQLLGRAIYLVPPDGQEVSWTPEMKEFRMPKPFNDNPDALLAMDDFFIPAMRVPEAFAGKPYRCMKKEDRKKDDFLTCVVWANRIGSLSRGSSAPNGAGLEVPKEREIYALWVGGDFDKVINESEFNKHEEGGAGAYGWFFEKHFRDTGFPGPPRYESYRLLRKEDGLAAVITNLIHSRFRQPD